MTVNGCNGRYETGIGRSSVFQTDGGGGAQTTYRSRRAYGVGADTKATDSVTSVEYMELVSIVGMVG